MKGPGIVLAVACVLAAATAAHAQKPVKGSALAILAQPSTGCQNLLPRFARLGPRCGSPRAQDPRNEPHSGPTLSTQDYIDIQQLVSKYAYAIDECTNNGYDYADLYVADGSFSASRGGKTLARYEGRDRLAEAARGGMPDCKNVPWAGIVHMLVNHVIEPAPGGATGRVYLVAVGLDGVPGKVEAQGRYEDVYVKTGQGWRFRSRVHVLSANQQEVSRGK